MAKHCSVCNQDYADDLAACPYCASAKKTQLAGRSEDRTTQLGGPNEERTTQLVGRNEVRTTQLGELSEPEAEAAAPSDSGIDFGLPPTSKPATGDAGGEPVSGASNVAWSSLVEEPGTQEEKEIKIDSPSDADILVHDAAESPPAAATGLDEELVGELEAEEPVIEEAEAGTEAEVVKLDSSPPQPAEQPSDSAVNLGGSRAELVEGDSGAVLHEKEAGESEVFMAELASNASQVDLVSDSGLDLSEGEVVEVAADTVDADVEKEAPAAELSENADLDAVVAEHESSAVDLGGMPVVSDASLSAEEAGEIVEVTESSGLDLEGLPVPSASTSELHPGSESSVNLGSHAEIAMSSPSDAGFEAVAESGIDLENLGESTAREGASDLALESLLSEPVGGEGVAEEEEALAEDAVVAEEEPVAAEEEAVAEEPATVEEQEAVAEEGESLESGVAAAEEPAVSEKEVDDLLAGLEEPRDEKEAGVSGEEAGEIAESEEAIAAAEEEEGAEATAEKEEKKPAKPVKQRSRIPALVGGTFLGVLIGAGGLIGARFGGFDVPAMIGLGEKEKARNPKMDGPPRVAPPVTFAALKSMVSNGDWEGAKKAGIDQLQPAKPDELATRGAYRLDEILRKVGRKINPQDPALQPALQDLQQAAEKDDADAIYKLAWIKELAGQLAEARADYAKGAQKFASDPEKKQWFEAAVQRVDVNAPGKAGGGAMLPLPERMEDRAVVLALLLIALQQPPAQAPQPPGRAPQPPGQAPQPPVPPGQPPTAPKEDTREAGFDFWKAVTLARDSKTIDEAIKLLDSARKLHDERRFKRLRKAQNPLSDPAEDIFLRCCDELKVYWQLKKTLRKGSYLTDTNSPPEALQTLIQKADKSEKVVKDLSDKLVAAKVLGKDEDVAKGLDRLIADKKTAEDTAADLKTKLDKATDDNTKLDGDLKAEKKKSAKLDADLTSAREDTKKLTAANGKLEATVKKITTALSDAKLLDPKGEANVGEAVKKVVNLAKIKDPQGMIRQQRNEIVQLTASLKQRWQPREMLPLWLLLLDENRGRAELRSQATLDVERVKMDPEATPVQKGEAEIVGGLALRNAEEFDKAKMVLEAARGAVDKGEWVGRANAALKEVSNPAAYFGRQSQELYDRGHMDAALAVLERALKVLPEKEHGKVLAQRSLIELKMARSKAKGALKPSDALILAASKDAAEAVKAGLAEGHYAAGRIAEALGKVDSAIKSYREALKVHGDKLDAEGARYRMALARALLLPRQGRPGQPAMTPAPAAEKVGWRDPAPYPAQHLEDMKRLVLMLTLGVQAPLLPGEEPGLDEAEKLADQVLKAAKDAPGSVPFNELSQAYAIKGRWSAALQTYVDGIWRMLPREYGDGLLELLRNDPRLRRPDILRIPNPLEAERYFAAGLGFYFARDYANAEQAFLRTVENDSQDARYFYFLGLSKLAQNRRRDARADFEQGAMLERVNRPSPAAVSESLERIQGPTRRIVNEFRQRP
ncbi:MAG TPA: hypothetical protein VMG10_13685 [Gemmataceae bacterium]|nr:hypothetical protein [Gemmataceae bacterium]